MDEQMINSRENAIVYLSAEMSDINQMMRDIHLLVKDQSYMIDSIEQNIENSTTNTKKAVQQLIKASKISK